MYPSKLFHYLAGLLVCLSVCMSSCKKENTATNNNNNGTGTGTGTGNGNTTKTGALLLHLHTYISLDEVDSYGFTYTMGGRKITLSLAQTYFSHIQLVRADGSVYEVPDSVVCKTFDAETYVVGEVPAGSYKAIRFAVGLDSAMNKKSPPSSHSPLNQHNMWYGNTAQPQGYVYVNLQGKIDTTVAGNGSDAAMQPFKYMLGTQAAYQQVTMPDKNIMIAQGVANYVHIIIDYSQIFRGVQLNNSSNLNISSPADNNSSIAKQLIGNIKYMFSYEE